MNTSINSSPKARPLPQFFLEQANFSTKKEKQTPTDRRLSSSLSSAL